MKLGVVFPQTEITADVGAVKAYAQAAEAAGFDHLLVYDHVLGAGLANRPDFKGPYNAQTLFHEPFVLFGYLAGVTQRLELVTGVIILPQRQTALVAKQAAEVDVLTGGRLRLGVGVGWNDVEYTGLNENFNNRGRRFEEQVAVLRKLWSEPVVDFTGRYHHIPEAGINPLPVQRPIPLWIGGTAEVIMARIGKLADGWFPQVQPGPRLDHDLALIAEHATAAGRDPAQIAMEGRITLAPGAEEQWRAQTDAWRAAGATHLSVNTMSGGRSPHQHIETIERYMQVVR
jgi:probable F420-dependent oxidoreductase